MSTEAAALPINKLIAGPATTTTPPKPGGANQSLGETDFLSLLTTELKNQDPLNPIDSTQSIAQLAQFSALQATTSLSTSFNKFESNFAVTQAGTLLGDSVTVATSDSSGTSSTVAGVIKTIQVVNGVPQFTLVDASGNAIVDSHGNPQKFQTSQITGIAK